jgi:putative transposase
MLSLSRFQELLKSIPRAVFAAGTARHQADKHSKGFGCWDQLVVMLYAQLSGAASLREVETGFNAHAGHHYHLGTRQVRRSTLAEANAKRTPQVYADLAAALMGSVGRTLRREGQALLAALDSTSITLKGGEFEAWTAPTRTRNTQGVKLHLQYAVAEGLPMRAGISLANVNDITAVADWPLAAGMRYVFDKGYCDYGWWQKIADAGSTFVTRFKRNAKLRVVETRPIPAAAAGIILSDEIVLLSNTHPRGGKRNPCTIRLRRIVVARPGHDTPLVLASNDLGCDAQAIADDYRQRWQIELFFKWIKQHLKIKRFLGQSEGAVRIQLLTALIAYLLVAIAHRANGFAGSCWEYLMLLRAGLFQRVATEASHYQRSRERRRALAARQRTLFA